MAAMATGRGAAPTRRIVFGTTVPVTARFFLVDQMKFLAGHGWKVHLVTSPGVDLDAIRAILGGSDGITLHEIQMERRPSVGQDIAALRAWVRVLREVEPDVVMVGTPKAGLLGVIAARWAGVRNRIYLVHGLRLEGMAGLRAVIAAVAERAACMAATQVVCVSPSLKAAMVRRRLVNPLKCRVLADGSPNGVDLVRFHPPSPLDRYAARRLFGIPAGSYVVGFAGRLTSDKGVADLLAAMEVVREGCPEALLIVAGAQDSAAPLPEATTHLLSRSGVREIGHWEDMPTFFHALDLFCLPSYREGMPTVNLEAAASGVPVVTTSATGCIDSLVDGETGRVAPMRDPTALARVICELHADHSMRARMGLAGRAWVEARFPQQTVWRAQLRFLNDLL